MTDNESHGWWQEMLRVWREYLADRSLMLTCTCGQQVIVMGEGKGAAIERFEIEIVTKHKLPGVQLSEDATCSGCGVRLFTIQKLLAREIKLEAIDIDQEQVDRFLADLGRQDWSRWLQHPTLLN